MELPLRLFITTKLTFCTRCSASLGNQVHEPLSLSRASSLPLLCSSRTKRCRKEGGRAQGPRLTEMLGNDPQHTEMRGRKTADVTLMPPRSAAPTMQARRRARGCAPDLHDFGAETLVANCAQLVYSNRPGAAAVERKKCGGKEGGRWIRRDTAPKRGRKRSHADMDINMHALHKHPGSRAHASLEKREQKSEVERGPRRSCDGA